MMRKISTGLALVLVSFAWVQAGSLKTEKIESKILGQSREYNIYLPDGYEQSDRDYPVLYLLHGAGDDYSAWVKKGNVQAIADGEIGAGFALPMIIVMPDAKGVEPNKMGNNMGYFNRAGWAYEDFFFKEFIPYIENKYRIDDDRDSRAVSGLSMGGGGTTVYAMRHPEMFSSACPMSGLVAGFAQAPNASLNDLFNQAKANAPETILATASQQQIAQIRKVRWYVDCGDDDFLLDGNIELMQNMQRKKIPLQFRVRDGGHTWEYWQSSLRDVLKYISIGFAGDK